MAKWKNAERNWTKLGVLAIWIQFFEIESSARSNKSYSMRNYNTDQSCWIRGRYGLWRRQQQQQQWLHTPNNHSRGRATHIQILLALFIQFDWVARGFERKHIKVRQRFN